MKVKIKTEPENEPLELEEVKSHLRLELGETIEDDLLNGLIKTARTNTEQILGRKLITQTWYHYRDNWPCDDNYKLPFPPFTTGTAPIITYTDTDSSSLTLSSSVYKCDSISEPGRIVLDYNESWPSETLHNLNPIRTEFVCGYGNSSNVPQPIKHGMLLLVGHYYENREETIMFPSNFSDIPLGAQSLLYPYRIWTEF